MISSWRARTSRISSVSCPRPMVVQQLMAKRRSVMLSMGKRPWQYSFMSSFWNSLTKLSMPMFSAMSLRRILRNMRAAAVVASGARRMGWRMAQSRARRWKRWAKRCARLRILFASWLKMLLQCLRKASSKSCLNLSSQLQNRSASSPKKDWQMRSIMQHSRIMSTSSCSYPFAMFIFSILCAHSSKFTVDWIARQIVFRRFTRSCSVRSWIPSSAGGRSYSSSYASGCFSRARLSSPRISCLTASHCASVCQQLGSSRKRLSASSPSSSSSRSTWWVIWSSGSTRSSSGITPGCVLKPVLRIANRFSMLYCAFWPTSASCSRPLKRSKMALAPAGVSSPSICPTSTMKSQATSTESSVGVARRIMSIWRATNSPRTRWLTRCATMRVVATQTILLLRSKERRNWTRTRLATSSPISGTLVLMTAMSAAQTCVKLGEAICALMSARASMPRPRRMFSLKSSTTMFWMLAMLTLLTMPLIDFRSSSHIMRWWPSLAGSASSISCCSARSLCGGTYTPPARRTPFSSFSAFSCWLQRSIRKFGCSRSASISEPCRLAGSNAPPSAAIYKRQQSITVPRPPPNEPLSLSKYRLLIDAPAGDGSGGRGVLAAG